MKIREFARHIGVSHPAVLKGCAKGRLTTRSVRRDARGRVVDIDPIEGAREWDDRKTRYSAAELNGTRPIGYAKGRRSAAAETAPCLVFGGLSEIERPGGPFLGIRFPLDRFVAGAALALRDTGKEATPDALRAVVERVTEATWWTEAIGALLAAAAVEEVPGDALPAMWERAGHAAVLGEKEASDGSEG